MLHLIAAKARILLLHWPWWTAGTSAAMLAVAHGFERFAHLNPCALCLTQREVYWAALGVSLAAILARAIRAPIWTDVLAGALLFAIFSIGTGVAVFHAGLEWGWWEMPACPARGYLATLLHLPAPKVSLSDITNLAASGPTKLGCDIAQWRWLGLSMAGWNAIISLKLAIWSLAYAVFTARMR